MITNVNFKSFEELCPNFKGKFQANGLHDSVKGFAGCYLVKTYEIDKKTKKTKTYYKIGYKGLTNNGEADSGRIKDYAKLNVECLGFIFQEKGDKREFDIEIHDRLKKFYDYVFEKGTFFGNDEEGCHFKDYREDDDTFILNCKQACYHYRTGTKPKAIKTQFWGPRVGSQDICIKKAFNYFSNNNSLNEFLIAAKCRYGKCYTTLKIIDKLETENVVNSNLHLVTSYRPSDIISEWYSTVIFHNDFNWDVFVHPSLQNKFPYAKTLDDLNENSKGIVIASTQCLIKKSKINDEVDYSKYSKKLQNLKFGVVCADEDDVGNNKENAINFRANNLNYEYVIRITGTAYQELIWESNKFNDENTYIFDYIEEQKLKILYKYLDINNPYKDMASMMFYTINLAEKIFNEEIKSEKGFSLNEFFRTKENDKTTFVHEIQVKKFITKTLNSDYCLENEEQWAIFESFNLKNILIKLPAGTIEAFDKIFKNLGFNNYEFIKYTGDNRDVKNKEELVSKIEKANAKNKKTITYTVYRLGRGVSVKQFDSVLHWAGTEESDISCYEQFNFRGQTPNANKEVCYVFDYAPNRISLMQEQIAVFRAKRYKKPIEKVRKEVLNYYPAFKLNNCNWIKKSYEDFLNELALVRDTKALTEELVKVSPTGFLDKLKLNKRSVSINTNNIKKVKYKITDTTPQNNEEDINDITNKEILERLKKNRENEIKKQKRKFVECLNNTLRFVWVRNNGKPFNSKIYKKLIGTTKVQDWIHDAKFNIPDNFYELLDEAYKNNCFVISFDRYLISTYNKKSFDELCPIKLGKNEYKTPNSIIEEMFENFSNLNKKNIFVEFCSKTGEFAKFGLERKYIIKENCYFNPRNSWAAALTSLNIFGDYDYSKHKNQIIIGKIEKDNKIVDKIKIKIKGEKIRMPIIKNAIMNPPWETKTDLHVKIVKNILDNVEPEETISIMPNDFLKTDEYNQKHKRFKNTKIDTMLDDHIEYSVDETNKIFNLGYSTTSAIMRWNKNGGYNYDTVYKDTSKQKEKLKNLEIQIQNLIKNDEVFKKHDFIKLKEYNGNGYFIPIGTHGENIATKYGLIENNIKSYDYNGREKSFNIDEFKNLKTNNAGKGIYVDSFEEGIRLLKLFRTNDYMQLQKWSKISCNGNFRHLLEFCPILKENEQLITKETKESILNLLKEI